jgi:predicted phosphodiesterase
MDKLIELGIQKRNGQLDMSWEQIGKLYDKSGENIRCKVKNYLKNNGELPGIYEKNRLKVLFISDQHCPFNLPIEHFKDYVEKIDLLILGGDIQDCQSISKFAKKYRLPFVDEMVYTRNYIMEVIDYIKPKKTIIIKGNHEVRLINYLSDKVTDDLLQLMPETSLDLIINNGFYKYDHSNKSKIYFEPLCKTYDIEYNGEWFYQLGDVIFSHPKCYKSGILNTTEKAYLYFLQKGFTFKCLVTAHTHSLGFSKYGDCYLYENGCLCFEPEYASSGNMTKPQSNGFMYLSLKDNQFNYNESKLISI